MRVHERGNAMSLRILVAALLLTPLLVSAQEGAKKPNSSYTVKVTTDRESYPLGMPIVVTVTITNTGDTSLNEDWFSQGSWFYSGVMDARGKDVETCGPWFDRWFVPECTLQPGKSLSTRLEIVDEDPMVSRACFRGQHVWTDPDHPDWRRFERTLVPGKYTVEAWQFARLEGHPEKELNEHGEDVGYHEKATTDFEITNCGKGEFAGYMCYMDLWSAIKKRDVPTARENLASLKDRGRVLIWDGRNRQYRESIYLNWGVYYFGRLCIDKEQWAEAEKTLAELKDDQSFPYRLEAMYFYLLSRAKQGKLELDDEAILQFKKETENVVLLPQLPFRKSDHKCLTRAEELATLIGVGREGEK